MTTTTAALPIAEFREDIVEAVKQHQVVVITAETGAGKSTQVPQYLLKAGYNLVVTEPRRLAARTLAQRVAFEYGEDLGRTIGYRTAVDRNDSKETRCLFATDGLALIRELMGYGQHNVLVLDEVHEWNTNMDVLIAWAKKKIACDKSFKLVIMSATLDAQKLSDYFYGAPIIDVPGRLFPIKETQPSYKLVDDVASLLREGRNVLVFQPGKSEISKTIKALKETHGLNAEILPLHGRLSPEEQAACFRHYKRPKCVVSTNVAQTSVTIDDIDAVVDSGMERRIELVRGVEGLYLKPISLADREQRKGRAGRCKKGIYIDHCSAYDRPQYPVAEILRCRLDQVVLRLAITNHDAEQLEFFHQPPLEQIREAKRALKAIGCMRWDGKVTKIGRRVARFGVSAQFGRMILEAEKLGVVEEVVIIASLLEQGGITLHKDRDGDDATWRWRKLCNGEHESDLMAQLAVYKAARDNRWKKRDLPEHGILARAYYEVRERVRLIRDNLKENIRLQNQNRGDRQAILQAVCVGLVDHVYWKADYSSMYKNGDGVERKINMHSVVAGGKWLVGLPWDLEVPNRRHGGTIVLRLVHLATKVDPLWLIKIAPQLEPMITAQLNIELWQGWPRPNIDLPDFTNPEVAIPAVRTTEYGKCQATSKPLIAYGTIAPNLYASRFFGSNERFTGKWFQTPDEAEQERAKAVAKLEESRGMLRREHMLKAKAELRSKLRDSRYISGYSRLSLNLRARLERGVESAYEVSDTNFHTWKQEIEALLKEFEQVAEIVREQIREEQRILQEQNSSDREILETILALVDNDLDSARLVRDFAELIRTAVGEVKGRDILREQFKAAHGWKKKQQGVFKAISGLEKSDPSQAFMRLKGGMRVKNWILAAGLWLKNNPDPN